MERKERKHARTLRLTGELTGKLRAYSSARGMTENAVIEQALTAFFRDTKAEEERIAELFLQKYEEKYSAYMTRVRLGTRGADVNSQIVLEVLNTLLMQQQVRGDAYFPTTETMHPVLFKAADTVRQKIAALKQRKDDQ